MHVFPPKIPLTYADSLPLGQLRSTLPRHRSCPSRALHSVFDSLSSVASPPDANALHCTAWVLTTMCVLRWECLREGQLMNCVVLRELDCADAGGEEYVDTRDVYLELDIVGVQEIGRYVEHGGLRYGGLRYGVLFQGLQRRRRHAMCLGVQRTDEVGASKVYMKQGWKKRKAGVVSFEPVNFAFNLCTVIVLQPLRISHVRLGSNHNGNRCTVYWINHDTYLRRLVVVSARLRGVNSRDGLASHLAYAPDPLSLHRSAQHRPHISRTII
jgi:hypothetical protein